MIIAVLGAASRFLRIAFTFALSVPALRIRIRASAIQVEACGTPRRTGNDIARIVHANRRARARDSSLSLAPLTDEFILAFNLGFFV
jgi:hypothetical protein